MFPAGLASFYWLDLQAQYDLAKLRKDTAFTDTVKKIAKAKNRPPPRKPVPK
jgi:plasmid maintenance system antidote protein VapI